MRPIAVTMTGAGFLLTATVARAAHTGPVIEMSLDSHGNVIAGWDNTNSFMNEDPPYGVTFDLFDVGAQSPVFRFLGGSTPTHLAYSFVVTTSLYYWNHLDANPQWGPTPHGQFIEINDANGPVAVVTDGVSNESPAAVPVPSGHEGGRKSGPINVSEDHQATFFIFTPDGQGGQDSGGVVGAYGFGMQIHLWQENQNGDLMTDHGLSDPFFVSFRVRPTQIPPPADWMSPSAFAQAVSSGQTLVPEPTSMAVWAIGMSLLVMMPVSSRVRQREKK